MLNYLKKLTGYRVEKPVEHTVTHPVRVNGQPAKHLEVTETKQLLHVTEGWFNKRHTIEE